MSRYGTPRAAVLSVVVCPQPECVCLDEGLFGGVLPGAGQQPQGRSISTRTENSAARHVHM